MPTWTIKGAGSYQDAEWDSFTQAEFADDGTVAAQASYDKRAAPTLYIAFDTSNPPADFPQGDSADYLAHITDIRYNFRFAHTGYGDDTFTMLLGKVGSWTAADASDASGVWGEGSDDITGDLGSAGGGPTTVGWAAAVPGVFSGIVGTFNDRMASVFGSGGGSLGMGFTAEHLANKGSDGPVLVDGYSLELVIDYTAWVPSGSGEGHVTAAGTLAGQGSRHGQGSGVTIGAAGSLAGAGGKPVPPHFSGSAALVWLATSLTAEHVSLDGTETPDAPPLIDMGWDANQARWEWPHWVDGG